MNRDEFRDTVRKMQDEGVPLTMANLLVRTELPRTQIETWLDDVQRDVKIAKPAKKPARETADEADHESRNILQRAKSLRGEIVGDMLKSQLGGRGDDATDDGETPKRGVKIGGVMGLVLPPAGLAYSAPWPVAAIGTVGYVALAWLAFLVPMIGLPYLLIPMHLVGAVASGAYAWRFNRKGRRTNLLPGK